MTKNNWWMSRNNLWNGSLVSDLILNRFLCLILLIVALSMLAVPVQAVDNSPKVMVSLLTQNPDPARAGNTVDMRIKLQNEGGKPSPQVVGEILPEFPFTLAEGQKAQQVVGELLNFPTEANFKILKYTLIISKEAVDKTYDLKFRHSQDGGINWVIETFHVEVTSTEYAQIIHVDKSKINPGEETPISFTINNIGKAPLTNMVFTWSEKNNVILPVNTDNTRYIPYLGIGESLPLEYTVVANPTAERGLYTINLKLAFDAIDSTGAVNKDGIETNTGMLVGGTTDFDVAFADSTSGKTSFSISNSGKNDASSVSVSLPEQKGFAVKGGSAVIIGNLNKGDFTLATFQLTPNPPATKEETRTLNITISFTDSFGQRHVLEKSVALKVSSGFGQDLTAMTANKKSTSWSTWVIVLLVLGIVGYFGYQFWKKKAKK